MGRPVKQTIANWKKKCDQIISNYIRSKGKCDRCGRPDGKFDCAHVISRKNLTLRWNVNNLMCLCFQCHKWWHEEPVLSADWFKNKYPIRYSVLQDERNKLTKMRIQDYRDL